MKPILLTVMFAAMAALASPALAQQAQETKASVKVTLAGVDDTVHIVRLDDGSLRFQLHTAKGDELLSPIDFARRVHEEQSSRSWILAVMNVTGTVGVLWVMLGLAGQVLFAGRMIVQWLASEKAHRSVVPTSFWWMALGGATLLLFYFIWRKDIVGILGQCTGWIIYVRNLYFIYFKHHDHPIIDAEVETEG